MKISQVSKKYNISIDTLRYYEKIGLLPDIKKNSSGIRIYDEQNCRWVEFIICMRSAGLSIEILKKYIKLCAMGDSTTKERCEILKQERKKLFLKKNEIEKTIEKLDYKIKNYKKIIIK